MFYYKYKSESCASCLDLWYHCYTPCRAASPLSEVTDILFGCIYTLVFAADSPVFTFAHSIHNFTKITEEAEKLSRQFSSHPILKVLFISLCSEAQSLKHEHFVLHRLQSKQY